MVEITSVKTDLPSLNFLIYADSGAGKTVFSGSAERVLFIAPEDAGLLSAAMTGSKADKIKVRTWDEFVEAYDYCYDNQFDLAEKYDWIAIDSITAMQGMLLRDIVDKESDKRKAKDQDSEVPQIQDYQKLYILMERMVLAFNDLPINTIYTALARYAEDPDGNEFLLPMIGSNKPVDYRVSMLIASHMTSYGHFKVEIVDKPKDPAKPDGEKKKVKQRVIYWEDNGIYRGKDRTTRLGTKMVLPARMALQYVTDVARGNIDKNGKPIEQKAPVKKVAAKKVAPTPVKTEMPNPAAFQANENENGVSKEVELDTVEA
jgi:AAA domain